MGTVTLVSPSLGPTIQATGQVVLVSPVGYPVTGSDASGQLYGLSIDGPLLVTRVPQVHLDLTDPPGVSVDT